MDFRCSEMDFASDQYCQGAYEISSSLLICTILLEHEPCWAVKMRCLSIHRENGSSSTAAVVVVVAAVVAGMFGRHY